MTNQQIVDEIISRAKNKRVMLLAPIVEAKKGEYMHIPDEYNRRGFARARVDGVVYALDEWPELDKQKKHNIEIVVDRLQVDEAQVSRLTQSVEQALDIASGVVELYDVDADDIHRFSKRYGCRDHPDVQIPDLEPRSFSFNAPYGACPVCSGLGVRLEVDPELILNPNLTIAEGAIRPFNRTSGDMWYLKKLIAVGDKYGFDVHTPVRDLSAAAKKIVLYGSGNDKFQVELANGSRTFNTTYEGVIPNIERRHRETESDFVRRELERYMFERPCSTCEGARLKPEVLAVKIHGFSIRDIVELSISDSSKLFKDLKLSTQEQQIASQILKEILARLGFLVDVGLNYLTLARGAGTLSGGEAQRIRLATQIGSGLMGVLYVLDEPSIGLHQRDNERLIVTLKHLRDLGNTVIVVEHDEDTIRSSDYVLDIGPGAGIHGGHVVAEGTPKEIAANPKSLTGLFLSGKEKIPVPKKRRVGNGKSLVIKGAREHNLKNLDVKIPLGQLVVISGVSGSGKSTLINDILARSLQAQLNRAHVVPGRHDGIDGVGALDKVITIDQSPIGRTPRSNPATYTGVFTPIRELFANTPEAKIRGYKPGRFSFNVRGGRCENCQGDGIIKIEMHFLPDIYVPCEVCHGKRYNREALEITYKDATISDVLEMTVEQAATFFKNLPAIARKLQTLNDVGLGYIRLGQSATTLSGGEAQRIKLSSELSKRATGRTLYILDEPTTGLHSADVRRLLQVLNVLVDTGNSIVVIEHNLDVIKTADYIIDMGPEGGEKGGQIIAIGTPAEITKVAKSYTGKFLKKLL
jgi:excinuclease ABC subunit A